MSAPIFVDPITDGAADPTVIHKGGTNEWWMFYTNRRATLEGPGVQWVHGSKIGIAISTDRGRSWHYKGTVDGLDDPADPGLNTHWAPDVIWAEGEYHMYLSYVRGTPTQWAGHERHIVHFVSDDLVGWRRIGRVHLDSDFVIDAAVARCPDGLYRLWYKDEGDGSSTRVATSNDLYHWTSAGVAIPAAPGHEGPNFFELGGWYWMLVDEWRGLGVFRSTDVLTWERQGLILDRPGSDPLDRQIGRHADVVTNGAEAAIYYFTHPFWSAAHTADAVTASDRRTTIHHARLIIDNDRLVCLRDEPPAPLDTRDDAPQAGTKPARGVPVSAGGGRPATTALVKPRVHAATVNILVARILNGSYPPGSPLPSETALKADLGVSHSAVREALRVLAAKGMVKARTRVGSVVQPRDQWQVLDAQLMDWLIAADTTGMIVADLSAVRLAIEPMAARLAAGAATARDLAVLEDALNSMSAAAEAEDIDRFVAADRDFHQGLLMASHNWLLGNMAAVVATTADCCLRTNSLRGRRPRDLVRLHADLLNCIRLRDPQGADALVLQLIDNMQQPTGQLAHLAG